MRKFIIGFGLVLLASCTGEAQYDGKTVTCKDVRDGETFSFVRDADHMKDIKIDPLNSTVSITIIDTTGAKRRYTSAMDAFYKCDNQQ